jgi:hypothetical protein
VVQCSKAQAVSISPESNHCCCKTGLLLQDRTWDSFFIDFKTKEIEEQRIFELQEQKLKGLLFDIPESELGGIL